MGDPWVAAVGPVLHDREGAAGPQHLPDGHEDRGSVSHEVQRVGHHYAVEAGEREGTGEVGSQDLEAGCRKPPPHLIAKSTQGACVAIHRSDVSAWAEKVCKREGESPVTRPQVCPPAPLGRDTVVEQRDEVGRVHYGSCTG